MLTDLRKRINAELLNADALEEAAIQTADASDDVKDRFIVDVDLDAIGGENDPEIEKLIDLIPEDEDGDVSVDDIEDIVENYIPEY